MKGFLEYLKLDSPDEITKEKIMSKVDVDLPLTHQVGAPLKTLRNIEEMALAITYALDHSKELGLSDIELQIALTRGIFFIKKAQPLYKTVTRDLQGLGDVIETGYDQTYQKQLQGLYGKLPAIIKGLHEKIGEYLGKK